MNDNQTSSLTSEQNRPLTAEELEEVTGYKIAQKQHEILKNHGVFSILKKATNTVFTNWYHINNPIKSTPIENGDDDNSKPNWDGFDG